MKILSIPFVSKKFIEKQIQKFNFDYYEIRADYNKNPKSLPFEIINERFIITLREEKYGGKITVPEKEKSFVFKKALKKGALIDCEIDFYIKHPEFHNEKNIILSYHNFKNDSIEDGGIFRYYNKVKYVKLALTIDDYEILDKVSESIKSFKNVILVSMGKTGIVTRLLYKKFNSVATYVGLDNYSTAKNQISVSQIPFDLESVNNETKIGGIVGGRQILNSKGLKYYNEYFKKKKINAVYLPFLCKNPGNLIKWLVKQKFYGLSITMPYKRQISKVVNGKKGIFNLLTKDGELYNTDRIAFEKAKSKLKITEKQKVLIYGSGSMALLATEVFSNCKLYIKARNKEAEKKIVKECRLHSYDSSNVDLLINCTPVGLNEDFFENSHIKTKPKAIIDLPYNPTKETSLVRYAKQNNITYVDGIKFWHWQSEEQLRKFIQAIENRKKVF